MSKSENHVPTPDGSVIRNTTGKRSKQMADGPLRLRYGYPETSHHGNPTGTYVFTRLGERERVFFTRLGNVKIYDETCDLEDHANMVPHVQLYLMGTARTWFDELPPESIDNFVELQKAFLAYFLLQKKYIKYPIESHHIEQREGESAEAFMDRFKDESFYLKGVSECLKIFRFMHVIINLDLIKWLNDNITKYVDAMMSVTMTFLRGELEIKEHPTSDWMNFMVVRSPCPYNGIIERPEIKKNQAVPSSVVNNGLGGRYITGEEYDKVFNHLKMLNAPFEGKVFTYAKQVKPYVKVSLIPVTVSTTWYRLLLLVIFSAALHGWYYMVFVTTVGEEYDKVFNHLKMLNAPFEGKVFTCAKQVKPYCNHSKGDMKMKAKSSSSVIFSAALHGWYYMVFVTTVGEEYDKVFNHLKMLNAPFEGKVFTCAKQVKPYTQKPRKPKRKDTQVPQPSDPTNIVVDEAVHKELGDRLVGLTARVESSDNEANFIEDASKQERRIDDIEADENITLVSVQDDADREMFDTDKDLGGEEVFVEEVVADKEEIDEVTLVQAFTELKTSKPKAKRIVLQEPNDSTTTTTIPKQKSKDKGKGIMLEEPVKSKKKDQIRLDEETALRIQAKINADYQLAERLQVEDQEELFDAKKVTLFMQLLEKRRKFYAAKRAEEKRNKPPTQAQQRKIMCTYLKNMEGYTLK
uniref:Retrotransposon gag domain-containing protein n=1 Tax=Tanacetum cinerariifolium TaxID=118510 RepID=A0A6L2MQS9_TANCI|nr:hypothetical protein [Tanacetum cinerariifolium]